MATEGCARILYCLLHTAVVHPILPLRPKPRGSATCLQTEPLRDLFIFSRSSHSDSEGGLTPPYAKRSPFLVFHNRVSRPRSSACMLHSSGSDGPNLRRASCTALDWILGSLIIYWSTPDYQGLVCLKFLGLVGAPALGGPPSILAVRTLS